MDVELVPQTKRDIPVLERLAQLYQYDFSEFDDGVVDEDGRFSWVDWPKLFSEPDHHAFLICADGMIAGFACCYRGEAWRDPHEAVWWMDQFFVMRTFRKRRVGDRAAAALFDRFPGTWEIAQIERNVPAQAFWRSVIDRYTDGDFDEVHMSDARWHGPVQYFRTPT
jgi:predicted acetyltransferase